MRVRVPTLDDVHVDGKRVLVRVDFNVPLQEGGVVGDDTRIRATLPTLRELLDAGATLVLASHLGRPKGPDDEARLAPVAERLADLLERPVRYTPTSGPGASEQQAFVAAGESGSITLLENTRFDARETKNDPELAKVLAGYADLFVNDAFGAAHRAHASTEGVARLLPSYAGRLLERELTALGALLDDPERPFVVVLGGAKVSDKIGVIRNLLGVADTILIGGAMAFTFAKAAGGRVGDSLVEDDKLDLARDLVTEAEERGVRLLVPDDVVCAPRVERGIEIAVHAIDDIPDGQKGLDVGPDTIRRFERIVLAARTVLWNGPMGVFEIPPFDVGTRAIAHAVAESGASSVIGGGDSVAAVNAIGVADRIGHVSTGGGASLEFLEGRTLPGVAALGSVGGA
ncbi:phosphoglycerate kinase [soil metagenome]